MAILRKIQTKNQLIMKRFLPIKKGEMAAFVVAIFMFGMLNAQTVSGVVSDSFTGETIYGATVQIKGKPGQGTLTDLDGKYTIPALGTDVLIVKYIGYVTDEISVNNRTIIDIKLKNVQVDLDEIFVVGTRNPNRTATESVVPVDVLDMKELSALGSQTSVNDIMNMVAPSFTSQPQTVADGTDHIDPASLRNLGPDQVLVLINGKRRHTSSLININGTVGAGSVGTDMNAIPTAAIDRIEVLRDGAAAQYGSDAIAGVINIVLKEGTDKLDFAVNSGVNMSENGNDHTGGIDGERIDISANYGMKLGKQGGFVNFTGSIGVRKPSSRAKEFSGKIYNRFHGAERVFAAGGGSVGDMTLADYQTAAAGLDYLSAADQSTIAGYDLSNSADVTSFRSILGQNADEEELAARGLKRSDFNFRVGQSQLREGKFFANMSIPIADKAEFYAFGGSSYRQGLAAGFYRRPEQGDGRANTAAFPNGFLPEIGSDIVDNSFAFGLKGKLNAWDVDFSNTWGRNSFGYTVYNSSNGSMGVATPREFDAGTNAFSQNTTNLDFTRFFKDKLQGLNLAFGAEYRVENFQVTAGEEASYATYDINGEVVQSSTPDSLKVKNNFTGANLAGAAQVFSGFTPNNEVNKNRNSIAGYADAELDVTKSWVVGAAVRMESYSDFGETVNGKIASRYKITKNIALRGAYSTGFRAPSLHQKYFSRSSTIFDANGNVQEIGTFSNNSRAADLLGIPNLKQETSQNSSFGVTMKAPKLNLSLTVDVYQINIQDRIVYTGSFSAGSDPELQAIFKAAGTTSAAFFANAIDTKSQGLDIVISHRKTAGKNFLFKNDFSATFSETRQVGDVKTTEQLKNQVNTFFGERERLFLESARPRVKLNLTNIVEYKNWSFMLRNVYFGEVTDPDSYADVDGDGNPMLTVYAGKVITDLSIAYKVSPSFRVTVGSNNLLDIYPDDNRLKSTSDNQFVYSRRTSQFGYTGRYVFARINFTF
jgi:iron complex outermembrane receptor protein